MTTWHVEHEVLRDRPYLDLDLCRRIIAAPIRSEVQRDGRVRFWGEVVLAGEDRARIIRIVTLEGGETIHTAFIDRNFRRAGTP